jgi:hypothetical protein
MSPRRNAGRVLEKTNDEFMTDPHAAMESISLLFAFSIPISFVVHSCSPFRMQRDPGKFFHIKFVAICWKLV